mgnify:CR=1 FL=1
MMASGTLFGGHMALRLITEREMTARTQRLNVHDSSNLYLELTANKLGSIDYRDYMGMDVPNGGCYDIHELLMSDAL